MRERGYTRLLAAAAIGSQSDHLRADSIELTGAIEEHVRGRAAGAHHTSWTRLHGRAARPGPAERGRATITRGNAIPAGWSRRC